MPEFAGFECPNFTLVPNDLLGQVLSRADGGDKPGHMADMSLSELRITLALIRLTWGFRKDGLPRQVTRASLTRLQKLTGLSRPSVVEGTKALVERGFFSKDIDGGVTRWSLVVKEVDYPTQVVKELNQSSPENDLASKGTQPPSMKETEIQEKETSTEGDKRPSTFQEWSTRIRESKNRPAELMSMFQLLYRSEQDDDAEKDLPSFSYIGRAARTVGGAGRLAELMWQHSTRPPTGDVLAYLMKVAKGGRNGSNRGRGRQSGQWTTSQIAASQERAAKQIAEREALAASTA